MTEPTDTSRQARFARLQEQLVDQWRVIRELNSSEQTIVVVPSISLEFDAPGAILQANEERFLFLLLLLRQPRARIIYVTSQPIRAETIDYHLALLPGVIPSHARKRLFEVAALDGSSRPLTRKLLDRPRLVSRIRQLVGDPSSAHLVPFNTSELEQELALRLEIPIYGCDPRFEHYGTKTGGRRLFAEVGVSHPRGREDLRTRRDIVAAVSALRSEAPAIGDVMTKLNAGVSGVGNALLDLSDLPAAGSPGEEAALDERLAGLRLEAENLTPEAYLADFERTGGVIEERVTGSEIRSPSVQLRITPLGEVQLLSTHDQLLGGATGQSYMGCRFPADAEYAAAITRDAHKIGERLASEGVLGRLAVDFVVARQQDGTWKPYAIEVNLRKGGTTHPYLTLEFLTGGRYDAERALFTTREGRPKYYVSSDHCESELFKALTPDDLFDFVVRRGLHFSQTTQTGVVLNMLSALTEFGRFGLTAVGSSSDEAQQLYETAIRGVEEDARASLEGRDPDDPSTASSF